MRRSFSASAISPTTGETKTRVSIPTPRIIEVCCGEMPLCWSQSGKNGR